MRARPSDAHGRQRLSRLHRGLGGARCHGTLPAQAHVAAWVAAHARVVGRALSWVGSRQLLPVFGPREAEWACNFLFFFTDYWKMEIGSKENRKSIYFFPVKMSSFFRCEVKVYYLLIKFDPTGEFNLKSSCSYSVNDEKLILQLKLEPKGKF